MRLHKIFYLIVWTIVFPVVLTAQYIWTGASYDPDMDDESTPWNQFWWGGNWQGPSPLGTEEYSLQFGSAESYTPYIDDNLGDYYRIRSLTIQSTATESYVFHGEKWIFASNNASIVNNSSLTHVFNNDMQFGISNGADFFTTFDATAGDILWNGDSTRGTTAQTIVQKTGKGALILNGHNAGFNHLAIYDGEVILGPSYSYTNTHATSKFSVSFRGGNLRVEGASEGTTTIDAGSIGHTSPGSQVSVDTYRTTHIKVDTNGGEGTTLVFTGWSSQHGLGGASGSRLLATLHFDLSQPGAAVHFTGGLSTTLLGVNGVIPHSTVTDSSGKTGFVTLVAAEGGGYNMVRLNPTTALPSGSWNANTNYHVTLTEETPTFVYEAGAAGSVGAAMGVNTWSTMTLRGSGTMVVNNRYLRTPYLLLEEGEGDFTINGLGLVDAGRASSTIGAAIRLYSYRAPEQGSLIINTDHFGWVNSSGNTDIANYTSRDATVDMVMAKAGTGTVVFRSPNSNVVGRIAVQEGRLQVEGDGFKVTSRIDVYEGILGGSGQIGGGDRWAWDGNANVNKTAQNASDIRYTPVVISYDGTLDATPAEHAVHDGWRGLQIYGSLTMEEGATFAVTLNSAMRNHDYDPLRVYASNPSNVNVTLTGDLQIAMDGKQLRIGDIVLLATDGLISGTFSTVNGNALGEDGHFVIDLDGEIYDFFLRYDADLGDGLTGVVLYAIPEPSTVALLAGIALTGLVWLRRRKA
jgi:hypothetical protein